MNNFILLLVIAGLLLTFNQAEAQKKGLCPMKAGIARPMDDLVDYHGPKVNGADIHGKDSVVVSPVDGRVREALGTTASIQSGSTVYVFIGFSRRMVEEGQMIKAGQVIGYSAEKTVSFWVMNENGKLYRNPCTYIDCTCELKR